MTDKYVNPRHIIAKAWREREAKLEAEIERLKEIIKDLESAQSVEAQFYEFRQEVQEMFHQHCISINRPPYDKD